MITRYRLMLPVAVLLGVAVLSPGSAQQSDYPIADKVAQKVIDKYQKTSCEELKAEKESPKAPSAQEAATKQKAVEMLKKDPKMREQFLNKVAPVIANKMFECGMIP